MNVFFTIVNNGYKYFALNFHKRWKKLNIASNIVFICTDSACYKELKKEEVNCLLVENRNVSDKFHSWETEKYREIVFNKLDIKKYFIDKESNNYPFITYIDTDIWIEFDFTNKLDRILKNMVGIKNDQFDIIFQDGEDYLYHTDECCVMKNEKLVARRKCNSYCTGFMVFNSMRKEKIVDLLSYKAEDLIRYRGNQVFINEKLKESDLNVYTIPKSIFPNFSTCSYYKKLKKYWMLHYTYLVGKEKIYYMKKNSHWLLG